MPRDGVGDKPARVRSAGHGVLCPGGGVIDPPRSGLGGGVEPGPRGACTQVVLERFGVLPQVVPKSGKTAPRLRPEGRSEPRRPLGHSVEMLLQRFPGVLGSRCCVCVRALIPIGTCSCPRVRWNGVSGLSLIVRHGQRSVRNPSLVHNADAGVGTDTPWRHDEPITPWRRPVPPPWERLRSTSSASAAGDSSSGPNIAPDARVEAPDDHLGRSSRRIRYASMILRTDPTHHLEPPFVRLGEGQCWVSPHTARARGQCAGRARG
jgi:hypothetical protein